MQSSQTWIERLGQAGETQSAALDELRQLLVRRLQMSFRTHQVVDNAFIEDIVQEALMKILDSLKQFEGRSKFETWATTIAIRIGYTELRRKKWQDVSLDSLLASHGEPNSLRSAPSGQHTSRQELIDALHIAIQEHLTSKQRTALIAELAGMPQEEIGRRTSSNRNAVYKLMHDARKRLRAALESAGYSPTDLYNDEES